MNYVERFSKTATLLLFLAALTVLAYCAEDATPAGKIYVTSWFGGVISVVDLQAGKV